MAEETFPDYKSTIRLPQTEFPMKGNLPQKEPQIIAKWDDKQIYQKILAKNEGGENFTLPDGPPYANGPIHVGHALNKILKDIIIKYKNMSGHYSPFIPGWDCHGLPIEHAVMKNLGGKAKEKNAFEIRELCRQEAKKWIEKQGASFRRLGVLADWQNPYLTMHASYEAEEVREFARAFHKGVVYLGTKPVYWNWTLQTALADAEVEYHNHKSPSIYVKFNITDARTLEKLGHPDEPTSFVIWTTTPWTLPANLAICLNPELKYGVFSAGNENFVLAIDLKASFEKETNLSLSLKKTIKGDELELSKARHPFIDRDSLVILGSHVTLDAGTGCVHTAPGHGADDYKVGLKYGLEVLSPVDSSGCYTDEFKEMAGINIFKANPLIVEKLKQSNHLLGHKEIEHSYPHCWRSKTPLIFRATPQWFIGLDLPNSQVRQKILQELNHIQFFPSWGEARLRAMMETRPDWCLSRQRIWGVPIPIFYCNKTGKPLLDFNVMMKVADALENQGGIDAFYRNPPDYFIGHFTPQGDFGSQGFSHGKDILDVWFDSGICHSAVQKKRKGLEFPADLYLEGSDQHRGWFNTSLLSSVATHGVAPFKALVTHGFVNDSQGYKMSKSKGNVIDPEDVMKTRGAEILRIWAIYEDYGQDLTCGQDILDRVTETYRRIRNTLRFLLGAISDFDPKRDFVSYEKMTEIDQWALSRLYELNQKTTEAYDTYSFYKIYHLLNNFFTVDLSATYLDILKDRLYTWKSNGHPRRSSQTAIYLIADYCLRMMAPILSFLSEEAYGYFVGEKVDSVFLLPFPSAPTAWNNSVRIHQFDELLKVRSLAQKELESLRANKTIGSSLEAKVIITAKGDLFQLLKSFSGLRELLIVSDLEIQQGTLAVKAEKAAGEKCVRCWTYSTEIGKNPLFPGVCPKCNEALQ